METQSGLLHGEGSLKRHTSSGCFGRPGQPRFRTAGHRSWVQYQTPTLQTNTDIASRSAKNSRLIRPKTLCTLCTQFSANSLLFYQSEVYFERSLSVAQYSTRRAKTFLPVLPGFLNRGLELRLTLADSSRKPTSHHYSGPGSSCAEREVKSLLVRPSPANGHRFRQSIPVQFGVPHL